MSTKTHSSHADLYTKARRHLSRKCPVMKGLIARVGPCTLTPTPDDPFTLIVRCVIAQQISTKVATSISAKLTAALEGPPIVHEKLARLTDVHFQACGVSAPKRRTLRAVCEDIGANPELLPGIAERDDDVVRTQLTAIKGIGPWTVDMILMFGFGRPDVLPVGDAGITPASMTALGEAGLRPQGLSGSKARAILDLAERVADGRLPLGRLEELNDEDLRARLIAVRGIGDWTADMFLIFGLGRLDILPVGDFGLRAGVKDLFKLEELPGPKQVRELAEPWQPYRSVATWYVWRSRGPVPQSKENK